MTAFISRAYGSKEWEVIIKTDNEDHYKYAELFARKLIDHGKTHTMTNADRYRAMSDEELADALMRFVKGLVESEGRVVTFEEGFREELLHQLQQPVKEDEQ